MANQHFYKIASIWLSIILISALTGPVYAADYKQSEWYRSKVSGKTSNGWIKETDQMLRKKPSDASGFYVASGESIACPNWRGWRGIFNRDDALKRLARDLRADVKRNLREYPTTTQDKCSNPALIIDQGKVTSNPHNKKAWNSVKATVIFVGSNTKGKPLKGFVVNDYLHERRGGFLYNANLQKICKFSFTSDTTAKIDCGRLGKGNVAFTITNALRGQFQLFGNLGDTKILATNMTTDQIRRKYPDLLD